MRRKIAGVIMSVILLGAIGLLLKFMLIDAPKKEAESRDLGEAYQKAYQKANQAVKLQRTGDLFKAAENYVESADKLMSALKYNRKDPKAPAVRKKMIDYYEKGVALFIQDALRQPTDRTVKVAYIFDGDTVKLEDNEKVRYLGIDTPEVSHKPGEKDEPFGKEATRANSLMVENKYVQLKYDKEKKGTYERTLAYVFYGNLFVNAELVRRGLAQYYSPAGSPLKYKKLFLACEALAKENKAGMWR